MKRLTLLVLLLINALSAQLVIHQIETTPEFIRPGEPFTVKILAEKPPAGNYDAKPVVEFAGVFSTDISWSSDDFLFVYQGGKDIEPLTTMDGTQKVWTPTTKYGLGTYSFTTTIPAGYSSYQDLYIIIRGRQNAQSWNGKPKISVMSGYSEMALKVEVAGNKYAAYNTAYMQGGKVSSSRVVIIDSKPEFTLTATPSDNPTYTFSTLKQSITITASGDKVDQATVNYKITNADGTESTGSFAGPSGSIDVDTTATVMAWVNDGIYWSYSTNSWHYTQDFPDSYLFANGDAHDVSAADAFANKDVFITPTLPIVLELKDVDGTEIPQSATTVIYYAQHNGTPVVGTNAYDPSNPFSINSSDTIRAIAVVDGHDSPIEGYWVYEQDLPDAVLFLNTQEQNATIADAIANIRTFKTPTLPINIELKDVNDVLIPQMGTTEIFYALNNQAPVIGTNKYDPLNPFTINSSDTIRAIAVVDGYDAPVEAFWIYEQDLPPVAIQATPSLVYTDTLEYNTTTLTVDFEVLVAGVITPLSDAVKLYFTIEGSTPSETGSGDITTVDISGDVTINALAVVDGYPNQTAQWHYDQEFPDANLNATPGSDDSSIPYTYNTSKMNVLLSTLDEFGAATGDTVFYSIASAGGSALALETTTTFFENSGTIEVLGDDTIWAYASGETANRVDTVWTYYSDLEQATITAEDGDGNHVITKSEYLFGHTLDVSLNTSNADTIRYNRTGVTASISDTRFITGTPIQILDTDPDTVVVNGIAYGEDYKSAYGEWTFIRDTLPAVIATPTGQKFTGIQPVLLSLDPALDNGWENVSIFYTLDGSEPDMSSLPYSGTINLDTTVTLKARAFADNRVESPITSELYTLVAGATSAWYRDSNGDGAIDQATIILSKDVSVKPSSIVLVSPFDDSETRSIAEENIELISSNELLITIATQFTFTGETGFDIDVFGTMNGSEYLDDAPLTIADSVAPVLISAEYFTGRILNDEALVIERAADTLTVVFSEDITIDDMVEPLSLKTGMTPYRVTFNSGSISDRSATFIVNEVLVVSNPVPNDSVQINYLGKVSDGSVVQTNPDNRWIELIVHEPPYSLNIKAISPSNPDEYEIPDEIAPTIYQNSSALVIVADFMMELWNMDGLESHITIFDPLGNIVAESSAIGSGEHLVAELKTSPRTRLVYYWNGKNKSGRRVGSGAYIALVTVTPPDGKTVQERLTIGVK